MLKSAQKGHTLNIENFTLFLLRFLDIFDFCSTKLLEDMIIVIAFNRIVKTNLICRIYKENLRLPKYRNVYTKIVLERKSEL